MNNLDVVRRLIAIVCAGFAATTVGCTTPLKHDFDPFAHSACYDVPRELQKATLSAYIVEPPDVLLIEVAHNVRSANDPIKAGEDVIVRADLPGDTGVGTSNPNQPALTTTPGALDFHLVNAAYRVQANGTVDLGPIYGSVQIGGLSLDAARRKVAEHLRTTSGIADIKASVSFLDVSGRQVIAGEHLVRPDGTVSLGIYGTVRVAGLTLDDAGAVVAAQLRRYLTDPEVRVDVAGYNSKVFYVVTDGGGNGERVDRIPYTGNETVLDAVAQIQGLSDISSKRLWIARPSPPGCLGSQVMMVDWRGITQDGVTTTNYQVLPGDRIYIKADDWIAVDNWLVKVTTPVERVFGAVLLGAGTYNRVLNAGIVTATSSTGGAGTTF